MRESFLHFIWQFQYFDKSDLKTETGETVEILKTGMPNPDSGPDFSRARVRIAGIEWHGDIEIHVRASDWYRHKHETDGAYNKVILHVVAENDGPVHRSDGTLMPTLCLKNRADTEKLQNFEKLIAGKSPLACGNLLHSVEPIIRADMREKALIGRLREKAGAVKQLINSVNGDRDEAAYILLARAFGFKLNADAFETLARSLPLHILLKHGDSLLQTEALFFGQGGFLDEEIPDPYYMLLQREYNFLAKKYNLLPSKSEHYIWKFSKVRPANFPTLRTAQLASLIAEHGRLYDTLIHTSEAKEFLTLFSVPVSDYWNFRYDFHKISPRKTSSALGRGSIQNLIINVVIPLLVCHALDKDDDSYTEKALRLLEELPAEKNKIIRIWENLNTEVKNAADTQAYIGWYKNYCKPKRCLNCGVGQALVRNTPLKQTQPC